MDVSARLKKRGSGFTQVPNQLITDSRISFRAKGIWALIESKPDGWVFREVNLIANSTEGRDAFRAAAKELIEFGWLKRHQEQGEGGRFITIYELMYSPLTENPSTVKPSTVSPSTENQAPYKDGVSKKEESPLPPAGAGVWEDDQSFMQVAGAYAKGDPARTDHRKAYEVWTAKGLKADAAQILRALPAFQASKSWKDGYTLNLSRWLSEGAWRQVAAGGLPPEVRKERDRIANAGLAAHGRIDRAQSRGEEPTPADMEAVRLWREQQEQLSAALETVR